MGSCCFLRITCLYHVLYKVIHKSLRHFRTRLRNNQDRHGRKEHINRQRISPSFFLLGALAYFQVPPLGGSRDWRKMAFTVNKKAFCLLEFAKTESIVTVQRRFRIMYHTEPLTDKTISEWYMKFQQSGCLCAAKRTGSHSAGIHVPFTNCFVCRWFCVVHDPKLSLHSHNWFSFGKFQETERYLIQCELHFSSRLPLAVEPGSTPRPVVQKKTWIDSLPIDMLLSAVSVLVVVQSSSEIPGDLWITLYYYKGWKNITELTDTQC